MAGGWEAFGGGRGGVADRVLLMLAVGSMVGMEELPEPTVEGLSKLGERADDSRCAGPALSRVQRKTALVEVCCFAMRCTELGSSEGGAPQPCECRAPATDARKTEVY